MNNSSWLSIAVSMTIWTSGIFIFNRAVHSMPDIRGRKMSINTTSGFAWGTLPKASSALTQALTQAQTQAKSGKELIRRVQFSRIVVWSSTSATLMRCWGEGSANGFLWAGLGVMASGRIICG